MGAMKLSALSRRAAMVGLAGAVLGCSSTSETSDEPRRVLFVCQYGSVKSAVARELLRRMAADRAIRVEVQSRGVTPEDHISLALAEVLHAEGLNVRGEAVRALSPSDLAEADIVVIFDPLPAAMRTWPARDWSDLPSMNANYPAAREVLGARLTPRF